MWTFGTDEIYQITVLLQRYHLSYQYAVLWTLLNRTCPLRRVQLSFLPLPSCLESLNNRYEIVNYSKILCITVHYVWCRFYDPPYLHSLLRFLDHRLSVNHDLLPKIHRIQFHIFSSLYSVVCHTVIIDTFSFWKSSNECHVVLIRGKDRLYTVLHLSC